MTRTPLSPLGLEIADEPLTAAAELRPLLAEHGVVMFRGRSDVNDEIFTAWLREFGDLTFTVGEQPLDGHPDLNVISNVGRSTPPRSNFHVDTSYVSEPPSYTALRTVQIPEQGGETVFSNQYRAYETLPEFVRQRLAGRSIRHEVTGVDPGSRQERAAWHPAFRSHPLTGRTSLYLSTPQRCTAISGLPDDEAHRLIEMLYAHSTRDVNCYRHSWRPGDVVVWDNACVLHRADHSGVVGDRVMHRGMVGASGYVS